MVTSGQRLTVRSRRREKLGRMLALSLALHLAIPLIFLIILSELPAGPDLAPQGKGSPPSVAMVMEVGAAEGAKLPTPSYAPAKVAPGETPSMAPPPPIPQPSPAAANTAQTAPVVPPPDPSPKLQAPPPVLTVTPAPSPVPLPAFTTVAEADLLPPPPPPVPAVQPPVPAVPVPVQRSHSTRRPEPRSAPQVATRNTLPVPRSHTMRQPNRTANNQGASTDSPGPHAVNSQGAPPHSTNGPDPTTSAGGAAGEDGRAPLLERVRAGGVENSIACSGVIKDGLAAPTGTGREFGEYSRPGTEIPARADFFHKADGALWVHFYFWSRPSFDTPVRFPGGAIEWTGKYGTVYKVSPTADNHLTGPAQDLSDNYDGTIELVCNRPYTHPF